MADYGSIRRKNGPIQKYFQLTSQLGDFATTLFQVVGVQSTHSNICISPFGVAALLSMVHVGAKGDTAKQLKKALGLGKFSDQEIHGTIGNRIKSAKGDHNAVLKAVNLCYVEEIKVKINDKFQSVIENTFGAQAKGVNFGDPQTRKEINSYVEGLTNKKMEDILSKNAIGQATVMLLVNAVYFKGDWFQQFDPKLTQMKPFFLGLEKRKVDVKMMRLTGRFRTGKIDSLDAQFIVLPYTGQKLSMIIILPNKIDGVTKVESNLSGKVLDEIELNARRKKLICVELPKFEIETKVEEELKSTLSVMGIQDLFTSGLADLSGVSDSPGLCVSNIVQKCCIKVDEKGMEAAAISAIAIRALSDPLKVPSFKVDHPAIFLVKDEVMKLVLFVGRLANPSQK